MNHRSLRLTIHPVFLWATLCVAVLPLTTPAHAKILASEALATAIANDNLEQVKRELLADAFPRQKFDFDEEGIERLGRQQLALGNVQTGVEILQLNQAVHHDSPQAANALGDAYRASGDDISARVYYDMALTMDPGNEHAQRAIEESGESAEELTMSAMGTMGDMEFDPEAMQKSMAQMGVEMTPEQMQQMQEAMAQLQQYQQTGQMPVSSAPKPEPRTSAKPSPSTSSMPAFDDPKEAMFCEGVFRGDNADKKIPDPKVRAQLEGEYGPPGDTLRTWNIETMCHEFLFAVPLWADVSPPLLKQTGANTFEDSMGHTWAFQIGSDGNATGVTQTSADGTVTEMRRLGDPRSLD